jgi:hypothetical protein
VSNRPLFVAVAIGATLLAVRASRLQQSRNTEAKRTETTPPISTIASHPSMPLTAAPAQWDLSWEPLKIGLGAFFALCVKQAFDTSLAYIRSPQRPTLDIVSFMHAPSRFDPQLAVIFVLLGYLIWFAMHFSYNLRLFFRLQPGPNRVLAYINLAATLSLFYLLAASIAPPNQNQLFLILLLLFVDATLPIGGLSFALTSKLRTWWLIKVAIEVGIATAVLKLIPEAQLSSSFWALIALLLISSRAISLSFEVGRGFRS